MYYIASCSFGKDSLAMVLRLIEENKPLDEVVFYDTGMEFQAIYNVRDRLLPLLAENYVPIFISDNHVKFLVHYVGLLCFVIPIINHIHQLVH